MALVKNIELENGIKVDEAYIRVESPSITKGKIIFTARKYVSTDKPFFAEEVIECKYDIEGNNPFKQAYEHLKTLDEFKDAKDV